jgi:uncharacterized protein (DUF362 family)/Pyruvate/2-oxoacid:ferredoxin oxidoreductase delta subunit
MMAGNDKKTVAVVRCDTYASADVFSAVSRAVDLCGGIGAFVQPGMTVLVKPNMLQGLAPDRCVTTHPEVVRAVVRLLREHGCRVIIADSPAAAIPYTEASLKKVYAGAGYDRIAQDLGAELNTDTGYTVFPAPEGSVVRQLAIINPALSADAIVVVSKLKTHMWTCMSGGAKNLFGLVPGLEKLSLHARFPAEQDFGRMLVAINEVTRPRLQVMDAVFGMEGNGPTSGNPRKIGAVLASADYSALDATAARLIGIDPMEIGTIAAAAERGLYAADGSGVRLAGDDLAQCTVPDYKKPASYRGGGQGMRRSVFLSVMHAVGRSYVPRPVIDPSHCKTCRKCERACPVRAIAMEGGVLCIDRKKCIRCYCCHEMCTDGAIALKRGYAGRFLAWVMRMERG